MQPESFIYKNPKLINLMIEYSYSHQNKTNQRIHKIAVPLIVFSILGLLKSIPGPVDFSYVFIILCFAYYAHFKDWRAMGSAMLIVLPMIPILQWMEPQLFIPSLIIFIVAWAGQFYGHHIEGRKPSFLKDISFFLIGPLWVTQAFFKK